MCYFKDLQHHSDHFLGGKNNCRTIPISKLMGTTIGKRETKFLFVVLKLCSYELILHPQIFARKKKKIKEIYFNGVLL